ncbi:MAG: SUMF1/EgtB/PvdO family nonheme iron enzyme [Victivallaceae bacterium]|nr:SUMF1/EgtB/PvdO family nonheme iron enzyme [Victivallaceae bacterium]
MLKQLFLAAAVAASIGVFGDDAAGVSTKGGVKMVLVPGGEFQMGNPGGKADAATVHQVKISPFYMDAAEVTQEEYERLMEYNPSKFRGEMLPVERTRWIDAAAYCNLRSKEEGLTPVYDLENDTADFSASGYRLPTEAEWEFACRAGNSGRFYFGADEKSLADYGWFRSNSEESTHKVAGKTPNAFGLFDMYGNVAEWCNDLYSPDYYAESAAENPAGPDKGAKRVLRGGSWADRAKYIGSGVRASDNPVTADICQGYDVYGFRCVRPVTSSAQEK